MTRHLNDLTPDAIAERLANAPRPTLTVEAQQRIESRLRMQAATPVAAQVTPLHVGWMFAAACLSLLLGTGVLFALSQDKTAKPTLITPTANQATTLITPTSLPPTSVPVTPAPTLTLSITPTANECERGIGYWFNHPEAWGVESLVLGGQTYTQTELLALQGATRGDASLVLSRQLLAAKLNRMSDPAIDAADALLAEYDAKLPLEITPNTEAGKAMLALAEPLASLNSCGEAESTPQATQDSTSSSTTPSDDGEGEATPDTCKNPPPEHAPADGWRERCGTLNPATHIPPGQEDKGQR